MAAYELVEKEIAGFQNSLPLMKELKHEALRKRHWDQLMHVTGEVGLWLDPCSSVFMTSRCISLHLTSSRYFLAAAAIL